MYSVYDTKISAYMVPFAARQDGEALRMFQQAVTDPGHQFFPHAGDYTLFYIGEWDDENATYEQSVAPINLGNGLELQSHPRQTVAEAIKDIPVED